MSLGRDSSGVSAKRTQYAFVARAPKYANVPTEALLLEIILSVHQQSGRNKTLLFASWAQFRTTSLKKAGNSVFLNTETRYQREAEQGRLQMVHQLPLPLPNNPASVCALTYAPMPLGGRLLRISSHGQDLGL